MQFADAHIHLDFVEESEFYAAMAHEEGFDLFATSVMPYGFLRNRLRFLDIFCVYIIQPEK